MDLVARIRQLQQEAALAGQAPPGRPTLARMTGATDYRIRQALADITTSPDRQANDGDAVVSTGRPDTQPATMALEIRPPVAVGEDEQPPAAGDIRTLPRQAAASPAGGVAAGRRRPRRSLPASEPPVVATVLSPGAASATVGARVVSWAGFVFGSVMSVAANVLHTWLPADDMPAGWSPSIAAQVGSAVWPIGLLLSVEVLSRVPWKPGWQWAVARFGGTGTVAVGAAVISYGHVRDVLTAWGYGALGAHVGPLVLDGLMVVSGFALLAMTQDGHVAGSTPRSPVGAGTGDRTTPASPAGQER